MITQFAYSSFGHSSLQNTLSYYLSDRLRTTVLNSDFPSPRQVTSSRSKILVCLTTCPELESIVGFITFPRLLALWEIQTGSSGIWTRIALTKLKTIITSTSYIYIYIYVCAWFLCLNSHQPSLKLKPFLNNSWDTIQTIAGSIRGFMPFPRVLVPKLM